MLYNWLVARQHQGSLLLRIEDTDKQRSGTAEIDEIYRALEWLQLDHDAELLQSSREEAHRQALEQLVSEGRVYRSQARADDVKAWKQKHGASQGFRGEEEDDGSYRLRLDDLQTIRIDDLIRGETEFALRHLDDPVIARSDGSPLYNLAVAVDDAEADIQLIIRGDDHLSNTPKQALILAALGHTIPIYAHLPLIHGQDGRKLSKRHKAPDGAPLAITVEQLRDQGYLPEALTGYLAGLGWGTEHEQLLDRDQLLEQFDLTRVSHHPAQFDPVKLRHVDAEWIRRLDPDDFLSRASIFVGRDLNDKLRMGLLSAQERSRDLVEAGEYVSWSWEGPADDPKAWRKQMRPQIKPLLIAVAELLRSVDWSPEAITAELTQFADEQGVKTLKLFQPLRVALTGKTVSPPIGVTVALLDREQAIERITAAVARIPDASPDERPS